MRLSKLLTLWGVLYLGCVPTFAETLLKSGTIDSIDVTKQTITVRIEGKQTVFKIDERSKLRLEGKSVELNALKPGNKVYAVYDEDSPSEFSLNVTTKTSSSPQTPTPLPLPKPKTPIAPVQVASPYRYDYRTGKWIYTPPAASKYGGGGGSDDLTKKVAGIAVAAGGFWLFSKWLTAGMDSPSSPTNPAPYTPAPNTISPSPKPSSPSPAPMVKPPPGVTPSATVKLTGRLRGYPPGTGLSIEYNSLGLSFMPGTIYTRADGTFSNTLLRGESVSIYIVNKGKANTKIYSGTPKDDIVLNP